MTFLYSYKQANSGASLVCTPILSGANGYANSVMSGASFVSRVVTNTNASGTGSLPAAVAIGGNSLITFTPGLTGTVYLTGPLHMSDFTIIDGRGADITIEGDVLRANSTTNAVLAYLKFQASSSPANTDAFTNRNSAGISNLWVHHCTFVGPGTDGLLDIIWNLGNLVRATIDHCVFTKHDKVALVDSSNLGMEGGIYTTTWHHNWFRGCSQRTPLVRNGNHHVYNNYYDGYGAADGSGGALRSGTGASTFAENNAALPYDIGSTHWTGAAVTAPLTDWAAPHFTGLGDIRIDGSLLLTNGGTTATETQLNPGVVSTVLPYAYTLDTADAAMVDSIKNNAGWQLTTCNP